MGFLDVVGEPRLQTVSTPGTFHLFPSFSPDGRWVAYASGETGRFEIWIRSYSDGDTVRLITVNGGVEPVWCENGELFYRLGDRWMSVSIITEPELSWGPPRPGFRTDFIDTPRGTWDVAPDGQRIFMFKRTGAEPRAELHLVTDWFAELRQLVSTDN